MRKIIIEISGGNVQEIYSTEKENDAISIYVVDWDNIEAGQKGVIEDYPFQYISNTKFKEIIEDVNQYIKNNNGE